MLKGRRARINALTPLTSIFVQLSITLDHHFAFMHNGNSHARLILPPVLGMFKGKDVSLSLLKKAG